MLLTYSFLIISFFILMIFFKFTTYHKYFMWTLPFFIGYSILCAYLFYKLIKHTFFTYYLLFISIFMIYKWFEQLAKLKKYMTNNQDKVDNVFLLSIASTRGHYIASCFIFLATITVTYVLLYNM